ncbi:hypothetical protein L3X38_022439 [Prunus dulcis]|uniref:KIB1-4 beta-propeller domain-containing protein n=1 Tax=Prunus dulcis TaxID=3755 RepID=A0AAD4VW04_PRUDU|nr:hypothetical protein L3X38_022439 [Prunus dulcis]
MSFSGSREPVYKVVLCDFGDDGGPQWVEIESIGTDALFLGWNICMSVSASDFPGCRPNSIYFINAVSPCGCLQPGKRIIGNAMLLKSSTGGGLVSNLDFAFYGPTISM